MKLRLQIYQVLVNRVPMIQKKYHEIRQQHTGIRGRLYAWIMLLWMNLIAPFRRKKWEQSRYAPDKAKRIPKKSSESALSFRESPELFAKRLAAYDVISFDIFDTMIFRSFSAPTDMFYLIGEKLNHLDFERIRRFAEEQARQKCYQRTGSYEVTLEEIYEELNRQSGIPKEEGMQAEIETEMDFCYANPYMLQVYQHLKKAGKNIICTSDMYLPEKVLQSLMKKCGYTEIDRCFISCEYHAAKNDGMLYRLIKQKFGKEKTYVHVGDNPESDIIQARKQGFAAESYRNVNMAGMPYRAEDLSVITGSVYRGMVNAHIHNGLQIYSHAYELGFIYGGLFVLGYCQFIHEYVQNHNVDKIIFLARDGDILNQVYHMLYPKDCENGRTVYAYWSRLAAAKMAAGYYKSDYFRRFLDHKVNQGYTLQQIFKNMELEDMLSEACLGMDLTAQTRLTDRNVRQIKEYLIAHWDSVTAHYEEQIRAGKEYYRKIFAGCGQSVVVDIGWAGSGAIILDYMVNRVWNFDCKITGLIAGTNTIHNAEPNMSEAQLHSGKLVSYLYSQEHNRDIWKWHDAAKGHNLGMELLLTSDGGSLKKFMLTNKEECCVCLKKPDTDTKVVDDIHRGIIEFVKCMMPVMEKMPMRISGRDAYGVVRIFLEEKNYAQFMRELNSSGRSGVMEEGI